MGSNAEKGIFCDWKTDAKLLLPRLYYQIQVKLCDLKEESEERGRTRMNSGNPNADLLYKQKKNLLMLLNSGGGVKFLWSDQVVAAAIGGADAKVDGGGCAWVLRRREEEDKAKGHEG